MWIIVENFIDFAEYGRHNRYKSQDCPIDLKQPLNLQDIIKLMPHKFRLLDDDGEVYYVGYYDGLTKSADGAFAPLDWAKWYAGCTTLEYVTQHAKQVVVTYDVWKQL